MGGGARGGGSRRRSGLKSRAHRTLRPLSGAQISLVGTSSGARADGSRVRLLQRLARTHLLILDDWGPAPLDDTARHDLLEVLDERHGRRGTLLTSQVPIDHWHEIVGDPTFGGAIVDRLLHNALTLVRACVGFDEGRPARGQHPRMQLVFELG